MNENVIVKEYEFDKPLIQKVDSIIDECIRDCDDKYFHTFDHICEYKINFTNFSNNEMINLTISDKNMSVYELNKKLGTARQNGFIFNQIKNFKRKIRKNVSYINIQYYLKLRLPIMHRNSFKKLSQNPENIQTHCNDRNNPFHLACRKWYLYNIPQF